MGRLACMRCGVQAQIKSHLVRRFAGGHKPTWKSVFPIRSWLEHDLMGANPDVCQRIEALVHSLEFAVPGVHSDPIRTDAAGSNNILAPGQPCCSHRPRPLEDLVFRAAGNHPPAIQDEQIGAEAKSLFHIVGYKNDHAVVGRQGLAKLFFRLPPQVRIQGRKRLIEEQRIRFNGHAPRNGHALPLAA